MATQLNPYIHFSGQAREALTFYASVLGGEPTFSTFAEFGVSDDPALAEQVMHGQLASPAGLVLMAADTPPDMQGGTPAGVSMSLSGQDEHELRGYFDGLAEGGRVNVPLEKAPWGDTFGMVTDKYGIDWMVNIT